VKVEASHATIAFENALSCTGLWSGRGLKGLSENTECEPNSSQTVGQSVATEPKVTVRRVSLENSAKNCV
jgi:hypothetical protein